MCDCVNWYYAVVLICIVIFFQIVMYKIGYMQGEQSAYKRYTKTCNVCRNKKMNLSEKLTSSTVVKNATVRKSRTVEEKGE